MIASGRPSRALRSKCTCSATCSAVAPGDQRCGRIHSDSVVAGMVMPPVICSATAWSQYSGLAFSVAASVL